VQLGYLPDTLLIELDGDRGDPGAFLRAGRDAELSTNGVHHLMAFAQILRFQRFVAATDVFSRHRILHEEHLGFRSRKGAPPKQRGKSQDFGKVEARASPKKRGCCLLVPAMKVDDAAVPGR
jgi:hypothetical protein